MKTIKTNKPREVFAWYEHGGTCFDCDFDVLKKEGTVSFVEKSAYDELQKKLEIALYALKEASEYHNTDDVNGEAGYICWKTLKQIEETKDENDSFEQTS